MIKIEAIPILQDNYVWAIHDADRAILIDPGAAAPILAWLKNRDMRVRAILLTHHHHDHVGGIAQLIDGTSIPVYGPARGAAKTIPVSDEQTLTFDDMGLIFKVLDTPGHTLDHVCYVAQVEAGDDMHLFSGDTLFSCGCGRLFEGVAEEMHRSLSRLAQLPGNTRVYCAHEYTLANIAFALEVEPENAALHTRHMEALALRKLGQPTLPVLLGTECNTNPFLRCELNDVIVAASQHVGKALSPGAETFAAVRAWKDEA